MSHRGLEEAEEDAGETGASQPEHSAWAASCRTPEDPAKDSAQARSVSVRATRRSTRRRWNETSGERQKAFQSRCYDSATAAKVLASRQSESRVGRSRAMKTQPSHFTHFDAAGQARMVDVGGKEITRRLARAGGRIVMRPETLAMIRDGKAGKG